MQPGLLPVQLIQRRAQTQDLLTQDIELLRQDRLLLARGLQLALLGTRQGSG